MEKINYEIIKTGSSGNCVIIEDVMVDCGVPFNQIKEKLYDIKYLIITHIHRDHLKPQTLKRIKKLHPKIVVLGNYEVHQDIVDLGMTEGVDVVTNEGFGADTPDYIFTPFLCPHDVLCYGYTWRKKGNTIIYATDTESFEHAPDEKYDYLFIESNHDIKKLEMARGSTRNGYDPYLSGIRHASTQQSKAFYYMRRRSKESKWIELHQSKRFY